MEDKEYYDYLINCGFSDIEAKEKFKEREIMIKLYFTGPKKKEREITSTTYKRAEKRLNKDTENWFGHNR